MALAEWLVQDTFRRTYGVAGMRRDRIRHDLQHGLHRRAGAPASGRLTAEKRDGVLSGGRPRTQVPSVSEERSDDDATARARFFLFPLREQSGYVYDGIIYPSACGL